MQIQFKSIPPELQEHVLSFLSVNDCVNLSLTCKELAALIFNEYGGLWRKVAFRLELDKQTCAQFDHPIKKKKFKKIISIFKTPEINSVNYRNIILNLKKSLTQKNPDAFFDDAIKLLVLKSRLGINPSEIAVQKGLEKMKDAALIQNKDSAAFDALCPFVLPNLKDDKDIQFLYSSAIGTLPLTTLKKMLAVRPLDITKSTFLQIFLQNRSKTDLLFKEFVSKP